MNSATATIPDIRSSTNIEIQNTRIRTKKRNGPEQKWPGHLGNPMPGENHTPIAYVDPIVFHPFAGRMRNLGPIPDNNQFNAGRSPNSGVVGHPAEAAPKIDGADIRQEGEVKKRNELNVVIPVVSVGRDVESEQVPGLVRVPMSGKFGNESSSAGRAQAQFSFSACLERAENAIPPPKPTNSQRDTKKQKAQKRYLM
jgi:hypothetical protein